MNSLKLVLGVSLGALACNKFQNDAHTKETVSGAVLRSVGVMQVQSPAFLSFENLSPNVSPSLLVSSFGKGIQDTIFAFENLSLDNIVRAQARSLTTQVTWPNQATMAPDGMFQKPTLVVAGGFLPPGKVGGITLISGPAESGEAFKITKDKYTGPYSWFYHRVVFRDLDGDGKLDILTARAMFPLANIPFIAGAPAGELLWLQQPSQNATSQVWQEHVIASGPDVNFELSDLDADGVEEIIATEFFSAKLSVWWKEGDRYRGRVVDDTLGSLFNLSIADINGDGSREVLVTNHVADGTGSVLAYEIPGNFRQDIWKKHVLLSQIPTTHQGTGQAAPGNAVSFFPTAKRQGKPLILVSGDGAERAYLLTPNSVSSADWSYSVSDPLVDNFGEQASSSSMKSVIGEVIVRNSSADGFAEIYIPAFHANKVFVLKYFNPQ
jgi:hypothetical protein